MQPAICGVGGRRNEKMNAKIPGNTTGLLLLPYSQKIAVSP